MKKIIKELRKSNEYESRITKVKRGQSFFIAKRGKIEIDIFYKLDNYSGEIDVRFVDKNIKDRIKLFTLNFEIDLKSLEKLISLALKKLNLRCNND